jgi:RHS repeat-associated protein
MPYDGLNRRVRIEERDGTNSTVTNYLWCGSQICQKLDASNNIIAEYFDQGEEHDDTGTILLYQKDQLGSIRGTVAPNSTQQGSATYTAYGQADRSSGVQADKGYAGMFLHQPSGLYLTWYRAYDPVTSRWLSRDPIEERGGINLYGYVLQNRVNGIDPQGLVNWNGSIYSIEYSVAIGVSTGVGLSKSGFSMSNISFSDNLNYLDPSVFNGKF